MYDQDFEFRADLTVEQRAAFHTRLMNLRDLLLSIPDDKYNHDHYVGAESYLRAKELAEDPTVKTPADFINHCGTSACALGYAAFNREEMFPELTVAMQRGDLGFMQLVDLGGRCITFAAEEFFGSGAYNAIFDSDSILEEDEWGGVITADLTPAQQRDRVCNKITRFANESFREA